MHPRAEELIQVLRLAPHPEGGRFAEVFRSQHRVRPEGGDRERSALTTIYFLLADGEVSRWHRLDADEVWQFHEGDPLEILMLDGTAQILTRTHLGPAPSGAGPGGTAPGAMPAQVVPAGSWLAARPMGAYALVGCSMGPGFEAEGFTLMRDVPEVAAAVARRFPDVAGLV